MARRRLTPTLPLTSGSRVAIYTRVSTQMQAEEGFSLDAQLQACRRFAGSRDWKVVREFVESGISAKDGNRPQFQKIIAEAKAHHFDIILVHKLDRFSRSVIDVLTYLRELNEWGVSFASVTEQFDFTTPQGKMMLGMLALFAEWYLNNLSQETTKGKRARAEAGLWNSSIPFGYRKNDEGQLEEDPDEAPGLRLAFEKYATGMYAARTLPGY